MANILTNFIFLTLSIQLARIAPINVSSHNKHLFLHSQCYEKPSFLPASYGDRFIPRRYALQPEQMISSLNLSDPNCDYMDIFKLVSSNYENFNFKHTLLLIFKFQKKTAGYWRQHSLRRNIKICLDLEECDTVLKFHDLITREMCKRTLNNNPQIETLEMRFKNVMGLDWPCKPRPKPLAVNDSTHDLPNFCDFNCKFFKTELPSDHRMRWIYYFLTFQMSTISSIGRIKAELLRRLIAI